MACVEISLRDDIAVDEHALDRAEGISVMRIEGDAQRRAVLEDHAPRAFDLDRQQIGRALEPADLELLSVECAGLDGGAVVVRHELVLLVAATDAYAFVRKCQRAGLIAGSLEIARAAVERDGNSGVGKREPATIGSK